MNSTPRAGFRTGWIAAVLGAAAALRALSATPWFQSLHQERPRPVPTVRSTPRPAGPLPTAKPMAKPRLDGAPQQDPGPGVLVCDPVADGARPALEQFGAGCARWLNLVVAGHAEFGRTPLWSSVGRVMREEKRAHLRLDRDAAFRLARRLGITHVAVGEIRGGLDGASCSLSYQLWQVNGARMILSSACSGPSTEEVVRSLPVMAGNMARSLGAASPRVPPAVGETALELEELGGMPWCPGLLPPAQRDRLGKVADFLARGRPYPLVLANFLRLLNSGAETDFPRVTGLGHLLRQALPYNALVLGQYGRYVGESGTRYPVLADDVPAADMAAALRRFPRSYLLRTAQSGLCVYQRLNVPALEQAQLAARIVPENPDAWLNVAECLAMQQRAVSRNRPLESLTPDERALFIRLSDQEAPVLMKVLRQDPRHGYAWVELSYLFAVRNRRAAAIGYFRRAQALDPADWMTAWWGLYLYRVCFPDAREFRRVAKAAVARSRLWSYHHRMEVATSLALGGLAREAQSLVRTDQERAELERKLRRYTGG